LATDFFVVFLATFFMALVIAFLANFFELFFFAIFFVILAQLNPVLELGLDIMSVTIPEFLLKSSLF